MPTEENTIGISELLRMLKHCWREEGFSFNLGYDDGYLKINNAITIAKVSRDGEDELKSLTEMLKKDEVIIQNHNNLVEIFKNSVQESQDLSKDIEKKS